MNPINQLFTLLFLVLIPLGSVSQTIDTVDINGVQKFVYPFSQEVEISFYYWNAMAKSKTKKQKYTYEEYLFELESSPEIADSMVITEDEFKIFQKVLEAKSYKKMKRLYLLKFGPLPTEEDFKMYRDYKRGSKYNSYGQDQEKYLKSRKMVKAIRANPYPFLLQSYRENSDIVPFLNSIPDGDYIQYYNSFCMIDKKGDCEWISDKIAGYFSIKNNSLNGMATWVGLQGDTLKHGRFENGLKQGIWKLNNYRIGYMDEYAADSYNKTGTPEIDSTIQFIEFKNGSMNGTYLSAYPNGLPLIEGHYMDNEESGEWIYRVDPNEEYHFTEEERANRDLTRIVHRYTNNDDESLIVKPICIREQNVSIWGYDPLDFNFDSFYSLKEIPYDLYKPAFEREIDLDLEEEKNDTRDYQENYDDYGEEYYDDYGSYNEFDYDRNQVLIYDPIEEKSKKRGVVYDSIGAYPTYINSYEKYYPNGQLAFKYEFIDGRLKEEPNVYWDNGVIHDEVVYVADSNYYLRNSHDYDGKLFLSMTYDEKGDFLKIITEAKEIKYIIIDGLKVVDFEYSENWHYQVTDSIFNNLITEKVLLNKTWNKQDTSVLWQGYYDPTERTRTIESFAAAGNVSYNVKAQFSENFESWTGISFEYFGDLELETVKSASLYEYVEADSIPQNHVNKMFNWFDITDDYTLKKNGELYSGVLRIDLAKKKMAIKDGLVVELACYDVNKDKLKKNFLKYKKKGKSNQMLELTRVSASDYKIGASNETFRSVFQPLLGGFFTFYIPYDYYDEYNGQYNEKPKRTSKKNQASRVEIIEGSLINGKPTGTWTSYDQFGNPLVVAPFENGEANGKVKRYAYMDPEPEFNYYNDFSLLKDSFPSKRTYYLSEVEDYLNGRLHGKDISYNWLGEILTESEYREGYKNGQSIERNNLAISISEYEDGQLDGYVKTYLTLPDKDSLLLYDLLFQNGTLQGESKSYHTNGMISKRGFFLAGEPIEDYEGFDSLGFRYHYVKFNYSYPVEEKIWEENELSVRYLFNWQDSIQFTPMDLTESESLDRLLSEVGLGSGYMEPYYGRPSLVEKSGIDYHLTKYYPNDTIARDGKMSKGRKIGNWDYYSYEGEKLHSVNYFDSIIELNDSIKYNSKGIYTELAADGIPLYEGFIIEKFERYDCSHSDHYETRQLKTIWEGNDSLNRMNGDVMNFYDNGTLQSAGKMKDGLPDGEWRFYDPNGKLNKYGFYVLGKRHGRWLSGDLSKTKYLGEICLNPNMPDIEEEIKYRENMLDIEVIYYKLGKSLHREYYDINMNFHSDWRDDEINVEDSEETDDELINDQDEKIDEEQ